jgi:disulfide bond formation protein DsbB
MITVKQAWVGFVILLLVMLLIVVAAFYWQHVTGMNSWHMLAVNIYPDGTHGC